MTDPSTAVEKTVTGTSEEEQFLPKLGQIVTAESLIDTSDYKVFGIEVKRNGVQVAVPIDQLPDDHFESLTPKKPKRAKKAAPKAQEAAPKTQKSKPQKAKKKSGKTPKLPVGWEVVRDRIAKGDKMKVIAADTGLTYYEVYRVKCHGMDL